MVDVRATNARVMIEDLDDVTYVRVTNARIDVEDKDTVIYVRVTNTRVMIEDHGYIPGTLAVTEADDVLFAEGGSYLPYVPVSRTKTPTHHQQLGVSIYASEPVWRT